MAARKVIAVDVDEVFSPLIPHMIPWYNRKYGTDHTFGNFKTYAMEHNFGGTFEHWAEEFVEYIKDSWEKDAQPLDHAVESIKSIMKKHEVFFMTARDSEVHDITERFIKKHLGASFTRLHSLTYSDKGIALKSEGADLLIDDSEKNVRSAHKVGIEGWLFGDYPHHHSATDLMKVKSWPEVCERLAV